MSSFTYNLSGTGTTLLVSKVRMHLGDNVPASGVLPDGSNLDDAEIKAFLTDNSSDVTRTVGALCSLLARRWANAADITVGPRRESLSQVSARWTELARQMNPGFASFAVGAQRSDGYSENANGDSEYT